MRQLLSAKHSIQLTIMEAFLEKNATKIEELEAMTGASKQTIRTYIDEIEQSTDFFTIEKGQGTYFLKRNNRTTYSTIYRYFYRESIQLRLMEYIFLNPFTQTKEIVEFLGISRSQFNQLRHTLKDICQLYDFSLSDSPFRLQGDYHTICAFYIPYMLEKYDRTDEFISAKESKVLDQIMLSFTNLPHIGGIQDKQRLKIWLWVIIKQSKHFPEFLNQSFSQDDSDQFVLSHQQFEETFSVKFPGFINSAMSELYRYLNQEVTIPELVSKKEAAITFSQNLFALLGSSEEFDNKRILDTILILYKRRNFILNNKRQRFVLNFFEQNCCFSSQVSKALQTEILRLRKALGNDSLFFELFHSLIVNETQLNRLVKQNQKRKKAGVLYTYDEDHSELFAYQLNNSSTNNLDFEVIDYNRFCESKVSLAKYDFIITSLTTIKQDNCIVTDVYPTVSDIHYLSDLVNSTIQQNFEKGLKQALTLPLAAIH